MRICNFLIICAGAWLGLGTAAAAAPLRLPVPGDARDTDDPFLRALDMPVRDADLLAAIAAAVRQNPARAAAAADFDASAAAASQTRAALLPRLELAISGSRALDRDFSGISTIIESTIPRGRADALAGIEAPLFEPGGFQRLSAARARQRSARAGLAEAGQRAALLALAVHCRLVMLAGLIDIADGRVARHRAIRQSTAERIAAGVAPAADLARAEAGLAAAEADLARLRQALEAARGQALAAGLAPVAGGRLPLPEALPASLAEARARSALVPGVARARAQAEAARRDAQAARADRLPTLGAGITATRFNLTEAGPNHEVRGQLVLRQRLSLGGAEAARVREAEARARALEQEAEQARLDAEAEAHAAFAEAAGLAATVAKLRAGYLAERAARDAMADEVRLRRSALIELIRSEDALAATAAALWQAGLEADLAAYRLAAVTGALAAILGLEGSIP